MSDSGSIKSFPTPEERQIDNSSEKKNTNYIPGERCGKWTELEHMRYIAFIDYNKQKMRSKEKRRSNKFYQQMADFIQTRNALQCRSHHQKLQQKYSHAPKIVNVFKHIFDKDCYKQALEILCQRKRSSSSQKSAKSMNPKISYKNVECQTQIMGLDLEFITINPNYVLIQPQGYHYHSPLGNQYYYNHLYPHPYYEHTSPTFPSTSTIRSLTNWESRSFFF